MSQFQQLPFKQVTLSRRFFFTIQPHSRPYLSQPLSKLHSKKQSLPALVLRVGRRNVPLSHFNQTDTILLYKRVMHKLLKFTYPLWSVLLEIEVKRLLINQGRAAKAFTLRLQDSIGKWSYKKMTESRILYLVVNYYYKQFYDDRFSAQERVDAICKQLQRIMQALRSEKSTRIQGEVPRQTTAFFQLFCKGQNMLPMIDLDKQMPVPKKIVKVELPGKPKTECHFKGELPEYDKSKTETDLYVEQYRRMSLPRRSVYRKKRPSQQQLTVRIKQSSSTSFNWILDFLQKSPNILDEHMRVDQVFRRENQKLGLQPMRTMEELPQDSKRMLGLKNLPEEGKQSFFRLMMLREGVQFMLKKREFQESRFQASDF